MQGALWRWCQAFRQSLGSLAQSPAVRHCRSLPVDGPVSSHAWTCPLEALRKTVAKSVVPREARDLELRLRHPLRDHRAPVPMSIRAAAGGFTEWRRGASDALCAHIEDLRREGFIVHSPLRPWLRHALSACADPLYASHCTLTTLDPLHVDTLSWQRLQDQLDACVALGVPWHFDTQTAAGDGA